MTKQIHNPGQITPSPNQTKQNSVLKIGNEMKARKEIAIVAIKEQMGERRGGHVNSAMSPRKEATACDTDRVKEDGERSLQRIYRGPGERGKGGSTTPRRASASFPSGSERSASRLAVRVDVLSTRCPAHRLYTC